MTISTGIAVALLALGAIASAAAWRMNKGVGLLYATVAALGVALLLRGLGSDQPMDIVDAIGAVVLAAVVFMFTKGGTFKILVVGARNLLIVAAALVGAWMAFAGAAWYVQLLAGGATVGVIALAIARRGSTANTVIRMGERARRRSGVATPLQVALRASSLAMHMKAAAVRPSLQDVSWWRRWRTSTWEVGVQLCKASGMKIWASCEDVVLVFGGPRTGKTAWLAIAAIFAAGAVVMTSTRLDLIKLTRKLREMRGLPTWVFNPGGLGDLPSDITFDPTHGCADPAVAVERAADMIPIKEDDHSDSASWDTRAQEVYAALLHAAGLSYGTRDSHAILRWAANPVLASEEILLLLQDSPMPSFAAAVEQFIGLADETRSSVVNSIMPALKWLTSESAVAATKGGTRFDVAELIRTRGTVYMLGRAEAHTAPLLAALNGYIAREARRLAALERDGRLDPPLGLHLDEAARVSPVPLPDWSGDSGGFGIQLICAFQSLADVRERWGVHGAAKVLNNAGAAMLFGGTKDPTDLEVWSKLAGHRDEQVKTRNGDGAVTSTADRKTNVLAAAQLSNLPAKRVVVFTRGMDPVVGRAPRVWEWRVQLAARRLVRASRPAPARPVTHSLPLPSPAPAPAPAPAPVESPTPVGAAPAREMADV